jgi:hypothetical protein
MGLLGGRHLAYFGAPCGGVVLFGAPSVSVFKKAITSAISASLGAASLPCLREWRVDHINVLLISSGKIIVAIDLAICEPGVPFRRIGLTLDIEPHDLVERMEDAAVKEHLSRRHIAQRRRFEGRNSPPYRHSPSATWPHNPKAIFASAT